MEPNETCVTSVTMYTHFCQPQIGLELSSLQVSIRREMKVVRLIVFAVQLLGSGGTHSCVVDA